MRLRTIGESFWPCVRRSEILRAKRLILVLLGSYLLLQPRASPQLKPVRRVVVFYELGLSSPAVALMDRELRAMLNDSPYQVELYAEHLETTLFDDPAEQLEIRESYIRKYQKRRPDLIVALGPSPLRFMVDSHEEFFTGIPIVFGGTSEQQADNPPLDFKFTGCWEIFEPTKTLDAALLLQPGTRHVVVVGGSSSFDKHLEALFRDSLHSYEARLDFTYLTDLDMASLLDRLKHLPDQTIVLYTHISMDAQGTRYVGASQAGPMVAGAASAPVFAPSDVDLGHGEVGGYLQSFAREGKIVGTIAVRILNGERPQDIPIVRGANAYMFDWRALKRWKFKESDLPPGSEVLFRPPSLWQRTKWLWVETLVITLSISILALYVRLKRAKHRQLSLSGMLINAQESERSRLASEIHDDFSQRLALLALELGNAEETIATSPHETPRRLRDLLNSASEIGADLHTLSHHLHSSTLERLGLVPGVTALCKEFSVQQGVQVDLIHRDMPASVRPEHALCLFRIVQESLRNFKRHSGAHTAQVHLKGNGGRLYVSVCDDGVGFDLSNLGKNAGLGLRSMEERAKFLGGRFAIHSRPGSGTKIEASIPIQPKITTNGRINSEATGLRDDSTNR
jgi:signal transduction histidine kinase/ABC-type uncharacterized transport system substrate-binding protein